MLFETDFNKLPMFCLQVDSLKLQTGKAAKQGVNDKRWRGHQTEWGRKTRQGQQTGKANKREVNKQARPTNGQDRHHLKNQAGKS